MAPSQSPILLDHILLSDFLMWSKAQSSISSLNDCQSVLTSIHMLIVYKALPLVQTLQPNIYPTAYSTLPLVHLKDIAHLKCQKPTSCIPPPKQIASFPSQIMETLPFQLLKLKNIESPSSPPYVSHPTSNCKELDLPCFQIIPRICPLLIISINLYTLNHFQSSVTWIIVIISCPISLLLQCSLHSLFSTSQSAQKSANASHFYKALNDLLFFFFCYMSVTWLLSQFFYELFYVLQ